MPATKQFTVQMPSCVVTEVMAGKLEQIAEHRGLRKADVQRQAYSLLIKLEDLPPAVQAQIQVLLDAKN